MFGLIWYVVQLMYLSYIWWKELKYPLPVHKSPLLDPILSHINPANILKSCLFNVNVNINLLCAPGSLMWYYSFRFRKHFCALIFSFWHITFPAFFILKVLDRQEGIRIWAALPKHDVSYCVSLWHGLYVSACGRVLTCVHSVCCPHLEYNYHIQQGH